MGSGDGRVQAVCNRQRVAGSRRQNLGRAQRKRLAGGLSSPPTYWWPAGESQAIVKSQRVVVERTIFGEDRAARSTGSTGGGKPDLCQEVRVRVSDLCSR